LNAAAGPGKRRLTAQQPGRPPDRYEDMSQPRSACAVVILPRERWSLCVRRIVDQAGALSIDPLPAQPPRPAAPRPLAAIDLTVCGLPRSGALAGDGI
jgi:hypothetical protein